MKLQLKKAAHLNWGSLAVCWVTAIAILLSAGQVLTSLTKYSAPFWALWFFKNLVALTVLIVPIFTGAIHLKAKNRQAILMIALIIGGLIFAGGKNMPQPLSFSGPNASPELYVVQNVFMAWFASLLMLLFAPQLRHLLHQFSLVRRRQAILLITAVFAISKSFFHFDIFGFNVATSFFWFIYLFAIGDWVHDDADWLKQLPQWLWRTLLVLSFLLMGVFSWLKMNEFDYGAHAGMENTTHYLLGINPFQTMIVLTSIILVAGMAADCRLPKWHESDAFLASFNLVLLGAPMAFTMLMSHFHNKWLAAIGIGLVVTAVEYLLAVLASALADKWSLTINWTKVGQSAIALIKRYWPILALVAIIWLLTIWSFGWLWHWNPDMMDWVLTDRRKIVRVNVLIVMAIFGILMAICNRLWLSAGITIAFYIGWIVASILKINARNEPILPSDLSVLSAPSEMLGMVSVGTLILSLVGIALIIALCVAIERRHGKKSRFNKTWRVIVLLCSLVFLSGFSTINHTKSIMSKTMVRMKDTPFFYAQLRGAKMNGLLLQFANNVDVHVMTRPAGYSRARMAAIENRYTEVAQRINTHRTHSTMGRQNLVFVLSESFADPRRVPGLHINKNPLPYYSKFKHRTTSGLMLSSGYGGGTANMEYMALTGLCVANFSPTMPTPYSQLVPYQKRAVAVNSLFKYSVGVHPFTANLYSRKTVYKKFGFDKFYHFDGGNKLTYTSQIDDSPRVSDWSTYQQIMWCLRHHRGGQFIQVATMQNHMPYHLNYYRTNPFKVSGTAYNSPKRHDSIAAYTTGIHYTDQALQKWVQRMNRSKKPITVVWYGDHLPGIYNGVSMAQHGVVMHETDYFIYSNPAAQRINQNRVTKHKVVGPNNFIAMALAQMDMKVSPYYALMTRVYQRLPAMANPVNGTSKNNMAHDSGISYVNDKSQQVKLTTKQEQLMQDYKLVQYDLTAGHHYLLHNRFMLDVPKNDQ